ncbi:hypothetical protein GALMADRAFT_254023 [Galerina marginata CBS 339.88]|uniref:Protein kinase domain-containing protein n=1 Tax=Galerina marginata (strain CBS 339.88) TaxID=685588 RepID=A0A067SNM2_GALM3|nr:hypothetical protein GALMADRAFT_254023 [Galerina marginata CBS 339.88]
MMTSSFSRQAFLSLEVNTQQADIPVQPTEDLRLRVLQWLLQENEVGCLKDTTCLWDVFPDRPSSCMVHIVVSDPEVSKMVENLDGPYFHQRKKLRQDLSRRIGSLRAAYSPSETISSAAKIGELHEGINARIHLTHPGGAPAAIFNPALAALQRDLDRLDQVEVTCHDVQHATEYVGLALKNYDSEADRKSATEESINAAVDRVGDWHTKLDWADSIRPDCCWWHEGFAFTVLTLKNIVGLAGNPLLEAILVYGKIISQSKYKQFREFCNFPIILVGVADIHIDISIAVWVGEIQFTTLLTFNVTAGFLASDNAIRLARVFKALSSCQKALALYYSEVGQKKTRPLSSLFPSPTPVDHSVELPNLTYKQFLTRLGQPASGIVGLEDRTTAMYIAALDGIENGVIVKFTPRYNEKAHRILASAGLAPKLHFCARIISGLYMVVMERVEGKSLWQLQADAEPIPIIILDHVRRAVSLLHEQNIVFGDLREPNILYNASESCVDIVDFDWSGVHNVDRYPATLNPTHKWPEDIVPYGLMLKAHDLWQLERLEGLCKPDA